MGSELADVEKAFFAFLFDADHAVFKVPRSRNYAHLSEQHFLKALVKLPEFRDCRARIVRGDLLIHDAASRLTRIEAGKKTRRSGATQSFESSEYGVDKRRLLVLIGELVDSLDDEWTSLDLIELPARLGGSNVFCLSAFPMAEGLAKAIDARLSSFRPYLGAAQLDVSNPLHLMLFQRLCDCVFFRDGKMYVSGYDDGGTNDYFLQFGEKPERLLPVIGLNHSEFQEFAPRFPTRTPTSGRAALAAKRLDALLTPSHAEKVAREIQRGRPWRETGLPFEFALTPGDSEQLRVPVRKLLNYALSTAHKDGQHKAKLFSHLLGISAEHWRYLAYQIIEAMAGARIEQVRHDGHGVKYSARVPVVGLNGRTVTVQTGWITRLGESAQLTTAYPADKNKQLALTAPAPPWVDPRLENSKKWAAIHLVATKKAEAAEAEHLPTPMKIEGVPIILDGQCGGAYVRLDGRRSFAKWLVAAGLASSDPGRGTRVSAVSSQSVERATAYALAYARVLWLNGIEAAVESYLS